MRHGLFSPLLLDYCLGFGQETNNRVGLPLLTDKIYGVTFIIWFKTTDVSKWISECLWWNGNYAGGNGYGLYAGGNPSPRDVRFALNAYGKWWTGWYTDWDWTPNKWQHIAVVFIYQDATRITAKFYLDGDLISTRINLANPVVPTTQSVIGYGGANEWLGFNSRFALSTFVDNFRVWNRVLTDDEIKWDMFHKTPDFEDLVLWLPMDEGQGGIAYDKSGYGNDGTLLPDYPTNAPIWVTR